MKSKIQGMVGGIALAAALACTGQAHAANDGIFTSSAQIGNLTYRLVDLDPTDGVGPSATFNMSTIVGDGVSEVYGQYDGSLLPSTSLNFSNANQSAEASPTGLKVTSVLSAQDLAAQISPSTPGAQWVNLDSPTPWISTFNSDPNAYSATITLSANTAIAISGTASINGTFAPSKVSDVLNTMVPSGGMSSAYLSGIFTPQIHLSLSTNDGDVYLDDWSATNNSEFTLIGRSPADFWASSSYSGFPMELPDQNFGDQRDFIIQFANFGATDKVVNLGLDLQSSSSLMGSVTLSNWPETPTIPEPSTYALMGLGLVGIGLARRKAAR